MTEEVKSVLTPTTWAALIVISVVMSFVGVMTAPFAPSWAWSTIFGSFSGPIIALFVILLISKIAHLPGLTAQKLGLVYAVTAMAVIFCWSMIPYGILHNSVNIRLVTFDPYTSSIKNSFVFGPSDASVVQKIQSGGVPTPWGDWSPWISWWVMYSIMWLLFWVGWMALLEERWIEVEKLPFPAALTGTMQIQLIASSGKGESDSRLKYFILGFIIGAAVLIPVITNMLYPAFPDIYGWTAAPYINWWFGTLNLAGIPATNALPVMSFLPVNPMVYALFYLFPAKILFSIWIFSLVGVLIPAQIAWYMGYYSGIDTSGWRAGFLLGNDPFKYNGIWIGAFIGLIISWFVLNPTYLRSLFKKPANPEKTAIPYTLGWIFVLGSTVALIAMLIAAGSNPLGSVLIVVTMWLLYMGTVRVYGFASITGTAWSSPIDWSHLAFITKYIWHPGMTDAKVTTDYTTTMLLTNRYTGELMGENNTNWGMVFAIPFCYKVGYDTGTHPRDITKVILVAGIISALVGFPTAVWFGYNYGTSNTKMGLFDAWWIWVHPSAGTMENQPTAEPFWPYVIAGIVLILILSFVNFRFLWWPLDPAGVALALGAGPGGWMFPALIGWVIKTMVIRTGGTKLNDRIVTPIMVGILVGYWLLMFLGAFLGMIQFFMPK